MRTLCYSAAGNPLSLFRRRELCVMHATVSPLETHRVAS